MIIANLAVKRHCLLESSVVAWWQIEKKGG
jgi:hypothetical protein